MPGGRPKGSKQKRDESKYILPPNVALKPGQSDVYIQTTPLTFIDKEYGEFTSTFRALLDARASTHPKAVALRREATNINKYGVANAGATNMSRKKAQKTMQEKYGKAHALQVDKFRTKLKRTLKTKYGADVDSVFSVECVRQKAKKTLLDRHGVTNAAKLSQTRILPNGKNVKEYCREKDVNSAMAYKIYSWYGPEQAQYWIENSKEKISGLEYALQKAMPELVRYETVPPGIQHFRPDFIYKNIYIDVDGLEYHSELYKDENNYHQRKRETYNNAGYEILQFRQDEVINKIDIVKSIIKSKAGEADFFYRASNLTFKRISKKEADLFLNRTHLMGSSNGVTTYGLCDENDKVVAVMTIKIKKRELEIVRFSSELNTRVYGALSKFLKNIKGLYKDQYDKIVYFVDLRYGSGKSVETQGFKLSKITLGWKWTDGYNTFNRLHCRANMDNRRLTEKEHAKELGLFRIYDAGQAKYEYIPEKN